MRAFLNNVETVISPLLYRYTVLALAALLAAVMFILAGVLNVTIEPGIFNLAAAAGEGLVLGLFSRTLFRGRTALLRWSSAAAMLTGSLLFIGWCTWGYVGVDPYGLPRSYIDWNAIFQILAGGICAALAVFSWRDGFHIALHPGIAAKFARREQPPAARTVSEPAAEPARKSLTALERIRLGWRNRRLFNRDGEVRLVGAEAHRCPYCLQPVRKRDARGVVICPVCKTWHHQDCWGITGTCQVPHNHV